LIDYLIAGVCCTRRLFWLKMKKFTIKYQYGEYNGLWFGISDTPENAIETMWRKMRDFATNERISRHAEIIDVQTIYRQTFGFGDWTPNTSEHT